MDFISLFIILAVITGAIEVIAKVIHGRAFLLELRDVLHALRLWTRHFLVLGWNRYARWRLSRMRRDIDAKCPSCGHRRGHLTGSRHHRMLIHRCLICTVEWGEPFLVAPELWVHEAPPGG